MQLSNFLPPVFYELSSKYGEFRDLCSSELKHDLVIKYDKEFILNLDDLDQIPRLKVYVATYKVFTAAMNCVVATAFTGLSISAWTLSPNLPILYITQLFLLVLANKIGSADAAVSLASGTAAVMCLGIALTSLPSISIVHFVATPIFACMSYLIGQRYLKTNSYEKTETALKGLINKGATDKELKGCEKLIKRDLKIEQPIWFPRNMTLTYKVNPTELA